MKSDILERLANTFRAEPAALRAIDDAAAEIERLRAWNAEIALNAREFAAENERLRAALELYRDAVRIDATMEGPKFMGANSSALKRAWDADLAALDGK